MIIYLHEEDFYGRIVTTKLEAEEKPKTYIYEANCYGKIRLSKEDIGKLLGRFRKKMYTFSPDNTPFIKALIEEKERIIENLKRSLESADERKTTLLELLGEKKEGVTE